MNSTVDSVSAVAAPVEPGSGFIDRVLAAADRDPALASLGLRPAARSAVPARPVRRPVAVVMRRRRTLLGLTGLTALAAVAAIGSGSWVLAGLAILFAGLDVAYLTLVIAMTHLKARDELTASRAADDCWWLELQPAARLSVPEPEAAPAVSLGELDLGRFVLSYFTGWLLMPVVGVIALVRGDLAGVEQSPVLGRIVAVQRQGRAQSLRLLVAGATTVAVAGGGAVGAAILAPGMASAAVPAQTQYAPVEAPSGIAAEHGLAITYLAQLNDVVESPVVTSETPPAPRLAPGGATPEETAG